MGVRSVTAVDFDTVGVENLAPQMWHEADVGRAKVDAVAAEVARLNRDVRFDAVPRRFQMSYADRLAGAHVFACPDDMDVRKAVYLAACEAKAAWFGDARVAGEAIQVLGTAELPSARYEKTLFPQSEAYQGSCAARMTAYLAQLAASLLVGKFAQNLRGFGEPYGNHFLSLAAWEFLPADG